MLKIYQDSGDIPMANIKVVNTNTGIAYFILPSITERFIKAYCYNPDDLKIDFGTDGTVTIGDASGYFLYEKPTVETKFANWEENKEKEVAYMVSFHLFKIEDTSGETTIVGGGGGGRIYQTE